MAGAAALVLFLDRSPSDVANQVTLLALLVAAAALGFAIPGLRLLTGLVLGSALPVAHLVYVLAGVQLPYPSEPPGLVGALSLFVLVLPAALAAFVGGLAGRAMGRS